MRGLLLKDWLVISRQTKFYFVFMIGFALIPSMQVYSVFCGALLPLTSFGYDERSRWDNMARVMPYSPRNVVAGKYVFGYLIVGAVVLMETVVQGVYCLAKISPFRFRESMPLILVPAVAALCVMALQIPIIYWIGTEKSRLILTFLTLVVMLSLQSVFFQAVLDADVISSMKKTSNILAACGAAVIFQFFSFWVSEKLYQRSLKRRS